MRNKDIRKMTRKLTNQTTKKHQSKKDHSTLNLPYNLPYEQPIDLKKHPVLQKAKSVPRKLSYKKQTICPLTILQKIAIVVRKKQANQTERSRKKQTILSKDLT